MNEENKKYGYWNSGSYNYGNSNSGYWNSGDYNSGNKNSGDRNSGNWNSGNWNSGYLNTNTPKFRIFNKETDVNIKDIIFPKFFYFDLTEWINEEDMTNEEKNYYPSYITEGGYLKYKEYKQAFKESWDKADKKDREKVKQLPNFDKDLFYEISGINVD